MIFKVTLDILTQFLNQNFENVIIYIVCRIRKILFPRKYEIYPGHVRSFYSKAWHSLGF